MFPPPSPASMSKFPSGGNTVETKSCFMVLKNVCDCYINKNNKMIRRVASVGWDVAEASPRLIYYRVYKPRKFELQKTNTLTEISQRVLKPSENQLV